MNQRATALSRQSSDWDALEQAGIGDEVTDRLRIDPELRERLRTFVGEGAIHQLPDPEIEVFKALGNNYFGSRGLSTRFWSYLTESELASFPKFPWPVRILQKPCPFTEDERIGETHFVFLTPTTLGGEPATLTRVIESRNNWTQRVSIRQDLRPACSYTEMLKETFVLSWHLACSTAVYPRMLYNDQVASLPPEYEVMPASLALFCAIAFRHVVGNAGSKNLGMTSTPRSIADRSEHYAVTKDGPMGPLTLWSFDTTQQNNLGVLVCRKPGM